MNYTEEFENAYDELQKAIKDRSHLVMKVVTDKNGHQRHVLVNPNIDLKKNKPIAKKEPIERKTQQKPFTKDDVKIIKIKKNGFVKKEDDSDLDQHYSFSEQIEKLGYPIVFDDYGNGVANYWVAIPKTEVTKIKENLPKNASMEEETEEKFNEDYWDWDFPGLIDKGYEKLKANGYTTLTENNNQKKDNIIINNTDEIHKKENNTKTQEKKEVLNNKDSTIKNLENIKGKYFNIASYQDYSFENRNGDWYLAHHSDTGNGLGKAADITLNSDGSITLHGYSTTYGTIADTSSVRNPKWIYREISVKITPEELADPKSISLRNKLKDYRSGFSYNKDFSIKDAR